MSDTKTPLIYGKILDIQEEVPAVLKDRAFKQGGQEVYKFRGIDDLYNAINPLFKKHRVFMRSEILEHTSETKVTTNGKALFYEKLLIKFFMIAEDGSTVDTTTKGVGMDSGDKAANKAMSVAQKYALIQMFSIPTAEGHDPENSDHNVVENDIDLGELNIKLSNCKTLDDLKDLWGLYSDGMTEPVRALFVERKKQLQNG